MDYVFFGQNRIPGSADTGFVRSFTFAGAFSKPRHPCLRYRAPNPPAPQGMRGLWVSSASKLNTRRSLNAPS